MSINIELAKGLKLTNSEDGIFLHFENGDTGSGICLDDTDDSGELWKPQAREWAHGMLDRCLGTSRTRDGEESSKSHCEIAGTIAGDISTTISKYDGQIPLALAVGVLRVVEAELLKNNEAI